jgi:hypothetical protein
MDKRSYLSIAENLSKLGYFFMPFTDLVSKDRLRFLGHTERHPVHKVGNDKVGGQRITKMMLHGQQVSGKRNVGQQEMSYHKAIKDDMRKFDINWATQQKDCLDRNSWRKMLFDGSNNFNLQWLKEKEDASAKRHTTRDRLRLELVGHNGNDEDGVDVPSAPGPKSDRAKAIMESDRQIYEFEQALKAQDRAPASGKSIPPPSHTSRLLAAYRETYLPEEILLLVTTPWRGGAYAKTFLVIIQFNAEMTPTQPYYLVAMYGTIKTVLIM